ncbi:MAG: protein kinase [Pirellulaceae bacterium]|nr:protein kinase [Pirellulaceae bacterium]
METLDDYELLEQIGRGGMGVVFKARQISLNRIVALKMIKSGEFADESEIQRFRAEAEAAANLDHPGIVPVYKVSQSKGRHFFSMGFVDGPSLGDRLREGPLEPRQAAELTRRVAEAVDYAHRQHIVHRDLKPGNVLIDRAGRPQITDFGLAKRLNTDSDLTTTGQVLGTPSYMSPEQAAGRETGLATDIYGLGAILYASLTGRPPHQGANAMSTRLAAIDKEPIPPRAIKQNVPRDLETICVKALHKSPSHRYATALDLADDLGHWLNNEPIEARPVGLSEKAWLSCRRRPALAVSLAITLAAVLLSAACLLGLRHLNDHRLEFRDREIARSELIRSVDILLNADRGAIPRAIEELQRFPSQDVVGELRRLWGQVSDDQKLPLAFALARHGDIGYLISTLGTARNGTCDDFVAALGSAPQQSVEALRQLAAQADQQNDWTLKGRAAILALHLGDASIAADIHRMQERSDPTQQTVFIHEVFVNWHGDLDRLHKCVCELPPDGSLCYGLSLAIGNLSDLEPDTKRRWQEILRVWYRETDHGGVHGAAGWALRQLGSPAPELSPLDAGSRNGTWRITPHGFTMVRRPVASSAPQGQNDNANEVETMRALWLSNVTISEALFNQFLFDMDESSWHRSSVLPREDHPARNVTWRQAIQFCNWLTSQEPALTPCYALDSPADAGVALSTGPRIRVLSDGTGYRLPTRAEWEQARRAGATTAYCFGNDHSLLEKYAVTRPGKEAVATRMCNHWGVFDIHGGDLEWSFDEGGSRAPNRCFRVVCETPVTLTPSRQPEASSLRLASLVDSNRTRARESNARKQYREADLLLGRAIDAHKQLAAVRADDPQYNPILDTLLIERAMVQQSLAKELAAARLPGPAEELFRSAITLRETVARDHPQDSVYQSYLGGLLNNFGIFLRDRGAYDEARLTLLKAIGHQRKALELSPDHERCRSFLGKHLLVLSRVYLAQGSHKEAAATIQELPELFPERSSESLVTAEILSECATKAGEDKTAAPADRDELVQAYRDAAVAFVREAVARGFRDSSSLKANPRLIPIHEQPQFKAIVSELESLQSANLEAGRD